MSTNIKDKRNRYILLDLKQTLFSSGTVLSEILPMITPVYKKNLRPKGNRKQKVFIAAILCLIAFQARYVVFFGHNCEVVNPYNPFEKQNVSQEKSETHCEKHDATEVAADTQSKEHHSHHKHSDCIICSIYDQLLNSSSYIVYGVDISTLNFNTIDYRLPLDQAVKLSVVYNPLLPRGPPHHI